MKMYTSKQVAEMLGIGLSTVAKHCVSVGIVRQGRDWLISEAQIDQIRAWIKAHPKGFQKKAKES